MPLVKFFNQWRVDPNDKIVNNSDVLSCYYQILFSCIFGREESDAQESLVEAYRLLKSTAYKLYHVMRQNHVLQDLVTFFASCGVSQSQRFSNLHITQRGNNTEQ